MGFRFVWLPQQPGRCDNSWMTGLSLALANLKPGTGKTTSAVWLAHVFAQAGNSVLLVDADPSGSALEWSDLAAMFPGLAPPQAANQADANATMNSAKARLGWHWVIAS